MTSVSLRPDPWSSKRHAHFMPEGLSIAEIVAAYPEPLPDSFEAFGVILVNGEPVPRVWWGRVRPRTDGPLPVVVTMHCLPQGGGGKGGGKSMMLLVGMVALLAVSAWISGGGIAALGSGFAAKAVAAVVGIGGALALKALAPPPPEPEPAKKQRTVSAGVGFNVIAPLGGIPTVLGRMRISPPALIPPFTLFYNNILYSGAIVGLAGQHDVRSIRINDAPIDDFRNVQFQVRTAEATGYFDERLTLNNTTILEVGPPQEFSQFEWKDRAILVPRSNILKSFPDWHTFKTKGSPREFRIRILWPGGIQYQDNHGDIDGAYQFFRIQIRRVGTTPWKILPSVFFFRQTTREQRQEIRLRWMAKAGAAYLPGRVTIGGWVKNAFAETLTSADTATIANDFPTYQAEAIFKSGETTGALSYSEKPRYVRTTRDSIDIILLTSQFPIDQYEIRIKRGMSANAGNGAAYPSYAFRAVKVGEDWQTFENPELFNDMCMLESVTTMRPNYPLGITSGFTLISVRSKNLALNSINALFTKIAPVYSGGTWENMAQTRNPADLFLHVLRDSLNANPLPDALIDFDSIRKWRSFCVVNDLHCNALIESRSVEETLQVIAAAGHAAVRRSDKWGVIIERSRAADPIVQVFSPRNTANNSIQRDMPTPVHGLLATFFDETDDYKTIDKVIYDSGYSAANATEIEGIEYPGKTNLPEVTKRAQLDLRQLRLRDVKYSFDTDAQFIVAQRGDLVAYTHDVLDHRSDSAWVTDATFDGGGNLLTLTVDATLHLSDETNFWLMDDFYTGDMWGSPIIAGIMLRRKNGTISQHRIVESSDTKVVTLVTPIAAVAADIIGALVIGGAFAFETRRCIVFDIAPQPDLTARVTLVDEAPQVQVQAASRADVVASGLRILEDGVTQRLLEDGSYRLME